MKYHESDHYPGHKYRDQTGDSKAMKQPAMETDATYKQTGPKCSFKSSPASGKGLDPNQSNGAPSTGAGGGKFKSF